MPLTDRSSAWPPGFAIHPRIAALAPELVAAFRGVPSAIAGDCLGRSLGSMGLRAYHRSPTASVTGPALTVRVRPGDNLMIHKALALASVGDVIVIDGGGDLSQALIGGLMRTTAIARGVAAFVVDGSLRDVAEWYGDEILVWARGHTPRGPSKDGPGEVNVPIACGGMAVAPGDLVIADADGVVAVPAGEAPGLLERARAHLTNEAHTRARNADGTVDEARFNVILRAKGCPV